MNNFSDIFSKTPAQWGLRGDPYLWEDMKRTLATVRLPSSAAKVRSGLEKAFLNLTGRPISTDEYFYVEKYAHGGMSSGGIAPDFWRTSGIPILIENFINLVAALPTEKSLDQAIDDTFKSNPDFVKWFLCRTKFAGVQASYFWSRSNNPWGRIKIQIPNEATGEMETIIRESETDVLVVFESDAGRRFAVHIENKLSTGSFTPYQVEMYPIRAEKWQGDSRYRNYQDWDTVLIAPVHFVDRNKADCKKFGQIVTHEELAEFIPEFAYQAAEREQANDCTGR